MTEDSKTIEEKKVSYLDSLSNLGKDEIELTEKKEESETMTVPPLKRIEKEEYEALFMHMKLVSEIRNAMTGQYKKPEHDVDESDPVNPFATVAVEAEEELFSKLALKFGIKNNIEDLKDTGIRFRLQQGYFIEAYNA
jgi:hypothetical protein